MKISKATMSVLEQLEAAAELVADRSARITAGDESLPSHFDKPAEYYDGLKSGYHAALEMLLMSHGQYGGFREITTKNGGKFHQYLF